MPNEGLTRIKDNNMEGGERQLNISKNDVLTFMAAIASIINLLIQWMT